MFSEYTFFAKDSLSEKIIEIGNIDNALSPCSTFKVFASLIYFEEGIFKNPDEIVRKYDIKEYDNAIESTFSSLKSHVEKEKYIEKSNIGYFIDQWREIDLNPRNFMKYSIVPMTQLSNIQLGEEKIAQYINNCDYGNKDLQGDFIINDKDEKVFLENGLIKSWLASSLKITSRQNVEVLEKFLFNQNDIFSDDSRANTIDILKLEILEDKNHNKYKLFGKAGSDFLVDENGESDKSKAIGRFLGVLQEEQNPLHIIFFEETFQASEKICGYGGQYAKKKALEEIGSHYGLFSIS